MPKTKRKKRKGRGKGKGSAFERNICRTLSLWWSGGKHDDYLWRSAGSGGRATVRGKKGGRTTGHCGDISPCNACIQPLFDLLVIEAKRGYHNTVADLLDKTKTSKQQLFESWIEQAMRSKEHADSFAWVLITKRDLREPMIYMPAYLEEHLTRVGNSFPHVPYCRMRIQIRFKDNHKKKQIVEVVGILLKKFLSLVHPDTIIKLAKEV